MSPRTLAGLVVAAGLLGAIGSSAPEQAPATRPAEQEKLTKELSEIRKNYPLAVRAYAGNQYELVLTEVSLADALAAHCEQRDRLRRLGVIVIASVWDLLCPRITPVIACAARDCPSVASCYEPDRQGNFPDPHGCVQRVQRCWAERCIAQR